MRAQIIVIISIFLSSHVWAATSLKVTVRGKYEVQSTEVFRDVNTWVCKTEHNPYTVSRSKPYSDAKLKTLSLKPDKIKCRDYVLVTDMSAKNPRSYTGCADDESMKTFLKELNKNCGR